MNEHSAFATRIENARRAQAQWGKLNVSQRCHVLRALRNTIASRIDQIISVISEEVGKPPLDALTGDIMVTLEQLRFYERNASRILRTRSIGKPQFLFTGTRFNETSLPHGVALIFSPWNYPFQLAIIPMATALFAGNAVLLKCSERTPRTASLIQALCREANLPDGLVQVSWEPAEAASKLIDAGLDFLFFTGSSQNGRVVAQQAAKHLIPAVFELGGKDACLVFSSCNIARAIEGAAYGAFSNAGQACVGVKRIYVEQPIYDDFLRGLLNRVDSLRIGTTLDSDLGPIRFNSVRELLSKQIDDAIARGATLHTAWQRDSDLVPPLVLTGVTSESLLLSEESFGPVVCVAPFRDEAHAVQLANTTAFALSASIFTGDSAQGERIAMQLNSGTCAINDTIRHIGNPQASFGGNSSSGYGRYHGPAGLHVFSLTKSVMTVTRLHETEIHWFPFSSRTFRRLRSLLLFRHGRGSIGSRIKHIFQLLLLVAALSTSTLTQTITGSSPSPGTLLLAGSDRTMVDHLFFASVEGFPRLPRRLCFMPLRRPHLKRTHET